MSEHGAGSPFVGRPAAWISILTLLVAVALARIVSTYPVFNHTIDEVAHVACGIEWLEKGTFRYDTIDPPLPRVSVSIGPYLAGVRGTGNPTEWGEATHILSANGHYWRDLTLARLGVLPYFVLATVVVFLWTNRLYGTLAGLLAAAVFTLVPTVLAHSAIATTDIAFTSLFCWALYAFTRWLREPDWRTAARFGIACGLALSSKLSTILFVPACAAAIFALYLAAGERNWRALLRTSAVIALSAFMVTWAAYRFSHAPIGRITQVPERAAAKVFGKSSAVAGMVRGIDSTVQIPAPELLDGIKLLIRHNRVGRRAYLFGQMRRGGWWYFYFAALAVKTPLAVLLLAAFGAGVLVWRYVRNPGLWEIGAPLAAALTIMIITAPSRINIGVRHVMPMFAFLSILAGFALMLLWNRRVNRMISRAAAVSLFGWLMVSSGRAHPDYLAYFNELGGKDPSRTLVISDLDWGQDLTRLSTYLREQRVEHVSIGVEGVFDPDPLGLPETNLLKCGENPSGWVAMELRRVRLYPECYPWFPRQPLITTVGKSMLIYRFPEMPGGER